MNTKTVLIVDDSRVSRMMTRQCILSKHPGWNVVEAGTGEEALQKIDGLAPYLVMMDVNMPGMGGIAAADSMRQKYPSLNIALLTANIQEATRSKAAALKAAFIEKPIVEARIHKYLDEVGAG